MSKTVKAIVLVLALHLLVEGAGAVRRSRR